MPVPGTRQTVVLAHERPHILLVEDARDIREPLVRYLKESGYRATPADSAAAARRLMRNSAIDLVILDIMMPGEDGLSLCRSIRENSGIPVIMLTARGEELDRIVGLEVGADDYVAKPFNPRELVARINAVLRRRGATAPPGSPATEAGEVSFGGMTVNLANRTLVRDGKAVPLTTGEFALLKVLVTHPRTSLSRDKLMELARGREYEVFDRAIDVQISRLRKLIEPDPAHPSYIQTVWGFGYVFVPDENT